VSNATGQITCLQQVIDVGHYTLATKDDQRALRDYMVDLHAQVLALVRQGQTWEGDLQDVARRLAGPFQGTSGGATISERPVTR
jgi:hypothetical protein